MKVVQTKMGDLISKPKMVEKVLSKPPFRFLHDTVTAVTNTTGFGEGLYSESERDSANITEKAAKIEYLEKIFSLVGICKVQIAYSIFDAMIIYNVTFVRGKCLKLKPPK